MEASVVHWFSHPRHRIALDGGFRLGLARPSWKSVLVLQAWRGRLHLQPAGALTLSPARLSGYYCRLFLPHCGGVLEVVQNVQPANTTGAEALRGLVLGNLSLLFKRRSCSHGPI